MALSITPEQRDALYDLILDRLSGIEDVWVAVCKEDYEAAKRLGMAFSDDLRLVSEDLGWGGHGAGATIELKTPPDVLRRTLRRIHDSALRLDVSEEPQRAELRENAERTGLIVEACRQVLAELRQRRRESTNERRGMNAESGVSTPAISLSATTMLVLINTLTA